MLSPGVPGSDRSALTARGMPLALSAIRVWTVSFKKTLVVAGIILLGSLGADASMVDDGERPLHVRVSPTLAHAPADVFIYVSVARRPDNRLLRVTAESEDFFRSSDTQLDGEYSARVTVVRFRELPPGGYEIKAELIVSNGRTTDVAKRTVEVF
jgi:hypothetical protein